MVSNAHDELIEMILTWLNQRGLPPDAQIFSDHGDVLGGSKPNRICGYFPDVICNIPSAQLTIIGEAKTPNDLETRHSNDQLEAFAGYLADHCVNGELVIATRFEWAPYARRVLRGLSPVRKRNVLRARVLCEFGEWE